MEDAPVVETTDDPTRTDEALNTLMPNNPNAPYDMYKIIKSVVDNGEYYDVAKNWAKNIITCFARMDGQTVGIIANQPSFMAGCLDYNASDKAARFIRFCDCFNIPLLNIVDVPGFLPGKQQEYAGVIRHGAKMLFAYCEATVPKITLIVRKAYGGSYIAMCSREQGADQVFAWPTAEIAVMGPAGAANIIFKKDPERKNALKNMLKNSLLLTKLLNAAMLMRLSIRRIPVRTSSTLCLCSQARENFIRPRNTAIFRCNLQAA